jgi:hypothetical protein
MDQICKIKRVVPLFADFHQSILRIGRLLLNDKRASINLITLAKCLT